MKNLAFEKVGFISLNLFKVFFYFMVNHHETTSWENMSFFSGHLMQTMVGFRPLSRLVSRSKWPKWLINGGDPNHLHPLG